MGAVANTRTDGPGDGFSGSFERASLADLVQLECQSGAERVIRVTSGDEVGYLYTFAPMPMSAAKNCPESP